MLFSANCSGRRFEHDPSSPAFSLGLKKQSSQNNCNSGKKKNHLMNCTPTKHNHTCSQWVRFIPILMQKNSRKQSILFYYWTAFPLVHPRIVLPMNWKKKKSSSIRIDVFHLSPVKFKSLYLVIISQALKRHVKIHQILLHLVLLTCP